jgi:hypothetical protein
VEGLILLLVPVVALLVWGVISPRSQWRVLQAWSYRNPEANEPSDAVYTLTRIIGVVLIVVLVWQVAGGLTDDSGTRPEAARPVPSAVATDPAEALRAAFGVGEAAVVMLSPSTETEKSARPLKVLDYQEVDAAGPPAYLGQALAGENGAWLVLLVRADTPPTAVHIGERFSSMVHVGVDTRCEAPCPSAAGPGENHYLVPVRLTRPLERRLVWQDNRPVGS